MTAQLTGDRSMSSRSSRDSTAWDSVGEQESDQKPSQDDLFDKLKSFNAVQFAIKKEMLNKDNDAKFHPFDLQLWNELSREQQQDCLQQTIVELEKHQDCQLKELYEAMKLTFLNDQDTVTSDKPEEMLSAFEGIHRAVYKTKLDNRIRKQKFSENEVGAYVYNLQQGAAALERLSPIDEYKVLKGVLYTIFGAALIVAAVLALIPTYGLSSVASGWLASAGMYFMLTGLVATPVIAALEVQSTQRKKVGALAAGGLLGVTGLSSTAATLFGLGSIQTTDVMKAGGSAVGLSTGLGGGTAAATAAVTTSFFLSFLTGAAIMGRGIYHLIYHRVNQEVHTAGCKVFSNNMAQPSRSVKV